MVSRLLRLVLLAAASAWLIGMTPERTDAQTNNCECTWEWYGMKYPLLNPVCGHGYGGGVYGATSAWGCAATCEFGARVLTEDEACGSLCYEEEPATSHYWGGTWRLLPLGSGAGSFGWNQQSCS